MVSLGRARASARGLLCNHRFVLADTGMNGTAATQRTCPGAPPHLPQHHRRLRPRLLCYALPHWCSLRLPAHCCRPCRRRRRHLNHRHRLPRPPAVAGLGGLAAGLSLPPAVKGTHAGCCSWSQQLRTASRGPAARSSPTHRLFAICCCGCPTSAMPVPLARGAGNSYLTTGPTSQACTRVPPYQKT